MFVVSVYIIVRSIVGCVVWRHQSVFYYSITTYPTSGFTRLCHLYLKAPWGIIQIIKIYLYIFSKTLDRNNHIFSCSRNLIIQVGYVHVQLCDWDNWIYITNIRYNYCISGFISPSQGGSTNKPHAIDRAVYVCCWKRHNICFDVSL